MAATGPYSIVLLFEDQANSLQVIPPLKEKGLDVHVVKNAGELIQNIAIQKFDLVCLSVNHPSASSLVQVLKIKTHVSVLVFGEDQSMETSRAVLKTVADYQLTGVISSYNLWMKIAHLVKEKQRQAENASRKLLSRHRQEDDNIVVKSSSKSKEVSDSVGKVSIKSQSSDKQSKVSVVVEEEKITVKSAIPKKEKKILMGAKRKAPPMHEDNSGDVELVTGGEADSSEVVEVSGSEPVALENQSIEVKSDKSAPKGKLLKMNKSPKRMIGAHTRAEASASISAEDTGHVTVAEASAASGAGKVVVGEASENNPKQSRPLKPVSNRKANAKPNEALSEQEQIDREIDQLQNLFFETDPAAIGLGNATLVEDKSPFAKDNVISLQDKRTDKLNGSIVESSNSKQETGSVDSRQEAQSGNGKIIVEDESSYQTEEARIFSIEAARARRKKVKDRSSQREEALKSIGRKEHLLFKKTFREAVVKAGESRLQRLDGAREMGKIKRVSLIPVDNISERGFIIVAKSSNDFTTTDEITGFKKTLIAEMKGLEEKHEFVLGDAYNIETHEVDLSAWAERSSQFFYTFENTDAGDQVMICFLKRDELFPQTCHMEEQRMHRIDIHEVPARLPVSFEAYLFLARNDKMLPYLRRGGSLTAKQIQRLYQRGFKFLYVKEEHVRDYFEFYYTFSLNQDFRLERKFA